MMLSSSDLNASLAIGRTRARRLHEAQLVRVYRRILVDQADAAADALQLHALPAAGWYLPSIDELLQKLANVLRTNREAEPIRLEVIRTTISNTLARVGISFDLRNPVVEQLLLTLGQKITHVTDTTRRDVMRILSDADARGDGIREAAAALRDQVRGIAYSRAKVIARTEMVGASNAAAEYAIQLVNGSARKAGEPDVIAAKRWLATGDNRTRPTHRNADSQVVRLNQPFSVGGARMMYPGDPAGPPEEVVQCRCTTLYLDAREAAEAGV